MTRFTASLIAALLCGTTLAGSANASVFGDLFSSKKSTQTTKAEAAAKGDPAAQSAADTAPAMDLEAGVRQAQAQRQAQHYDEAIRTLSQLMLVASDDARVVGEYGKTLAEKGRAQDAVQFLTRATQLQPTDWSLYSALGVAYDQVGDQSSARMAYEHALQLNPTEPSILNNYALSRMLANDPDTARQLIARAEAAGGSSDAKIARNIELVNRLAPAAQPAPAPDKVAAEPPVTVSTPVAVNSAPLPPADKKDVPAPKVASQTAPAKPQADAVKSATHEPTPLATQAATQKAEAKPEAAKTETAKAEPIKAVPAKPGTAVAAAKPEVKPESKPVKVELRTDTKPQSKPASKAIPALRQTASVY
jgi:Flp pilus assembly protein TadD